MIRHGANATRTAQDYEMILFAFRDNALQNYVEQNPALLVNTARAIAALTKASPGASSMHGAVAALISLPATEPMIKALTPRSQAFYHTDRRYGE